MGTDSTSNNLNSTLDGYEHIMLAIDLDTTNWAMLQVLAREVVAGQSEADWLDAIIVAIDVFKLHRLEEIHFKKRIFQLICSLFSQYEKVQNVQNCYNQSVSVGGASGEC